jgi:hypothetical protein
LLLGDRGHGGGLDVVAALEEGATLEEDRPRDGAPDGTAAQEELEVHAKMHELLDLSIAMSALASSFFSTAMRCSYQPTASASSMSETIILAKVRVSSGNSLGGSWYWSKDICFPFS